MGNSDLKGSLYLVLLLGVLLTACVPQRVPLLRPNGVAVATDGSVYVMDRGNYRVVSFSAEGRFLNAFGKFGVRPEQIHSGWDLAIDADDNLYFGNLTFSEEGDLIRDGIKVFSSNGVFLREIGVMEYNPDDSTQRPYGVALDAQGHLYVSNFASNILRVFTTQGELQGTFFGEAGSEPGQFNGLSDVAVDDTRGQLYIVDQVNARVQQFTLTTTPDGALTLTFERVFGEYGDQPGQFAYPQYIAVDATLGRVYVADLGNERVQVFDCEGRYLDAFAPPDTDVWQALGITVGPNGAVYVTDAFNNAVWVFAPDGSLRARLEVLP